MASDRRSYLRYPHSREAEIACDDGRETCLIRNISAGGAAFSSTWRPDLESLVTIHLDEIEPFQGRVTRHLIDGFAVEFDFNDEAGAVTADRLTILSDMSQFLS